MHQCIGKSSWHVIRTLRFIDILRSNWSLKCCNEQTKWLRLVEIAVVLVITDLMGEVARLEQVVTMHSTVA
jgi:hypothetical protein